MFRKIYDCINPMVVIPICGVLYGLIRGAGAYFDSVNAGDAMTPPQIAGYMLGAVFVWGLAGLAVGWAFQWLEKRGARREARAGEPERQG
ncbi:hypothetical protein [Oceanicola sp. 502str15]|uniref:hypothetical protein n=1 Tax=Oceanicola sp. 502str15 TaxID=2696061 RepID=UPI0020944108|nr:hypothetical protein [Oceanicola sp. 502str15]MCO6383102.1 hypothetical protein [Oceanicola sp. 502str15]